MTVFNVFASLEIFSVFHLCYETIPIAITVGQGEVHLSP
jgi:hypothetical protein